MPIANSDDDEDELYEEWYEDDDDPDDEAPARCPECGKRVHAVTEKCPACGYWLTESDRRAMWSGESQPRWIKITAIVVLAAFLLSLFGVVVSVF